MMKFFASATNTSPLREISTKPAIDIIGPPNDHHEDESDEEYRSRTQGK